MGAGLTELISKIKELEEKQKSLLEMKNKAERQLKEAEEKVRMCNPKEGGGD